MLGKVIRKLGWFGECYENKRIEIEKFQGISGA
jgi:hypothetical protein